MENEENRTNTTNEEKTKGKKEFYHPYKVMPGDTITIRRKDVMSNERPYVFYSVELPGVTNGGEKCTYKKEVSFKRDVWLEDNTRIKVLKLFESARLNPRDQYYPIWRLVILDFEIVQEPNFYELEQQEIEHYQASDLIY